MYECRLIYGSLEHAGLDVNAVNVVDVNVSEVNEKQREGTGEFIEFRAGRQMIPEAHLTLLSIDATVSTGQTAHFH